MSLKTLNDFIEKYEEDYMNNEHTHGMIDGWNLIRQEAIKWVKRGRDPIYVGLGEREFMKFHNITEEDLE